MSLRTRKKHESSCPFTCSCCVHRCRRTNMRYFIRNKSHSDVVWRVTTYVLVYPAYVLLSPDCSLVCHKVAAFVRFIDLCNLFNTVTLGDVGIDSRVSCIAPPTGAFIVIITCG